MKTTALVLGIIGLPACSSCRCDFDEDEPGNKYGTKEKSAGHTASKTDTLQIR